MTELWINNRYELINCPYQSQYMLDFSFHWLYLDMRCLRARNRVSMELSPIPGNFWAACRPRWNLGGPHLTSCSKGL